MIPRILGFLAVPAVIIAIITGLVILVAGTGYSTDPDQVAVYYKAGPFSNVQYDHFVGPGDRSIFSGVADKVYYYPAGQRTYAFDTSKNADGGEITVNDRDGIELTVEGVARFELNTDEKTLQQFHEKIGLKSGAFTDGKNETAEGWRDMLNKYMRSELRQVVTEATQGLTWKQVYNDPKIRNQWEKKIVETLPQRIESAMGGKYFENFSMTLQKPKLPGELVEALQAKQTAIEQNNAQKERNEKIFTELDAVKEQIKILGPNAYILQQAIEKGQIQIMPVPQGTDLILNGAGNTK